MIFSTLDFFLFFLIIFSLYHLSEKIFQGKPSSLILMAGSVFFICYNSYSNTLPLVVSLIWNYFAACYLCNKTDKKILFLYIFIIGNILILTLFKYSSDIFGVQQSFIPTLGISYYTFQQISYLLYISDKPAERLSFFYHSKFVLFFPTLSAGPIPRLNEAENWLYKKQSPKYTFGVLCIGIGLFKKLVLAQYLASIVASSNQYGNANISVLDAWLIEISYFLQLYFDLSGYADIAIGLAALFGYKLPINFNSPLKAKNISAFWAAWHMSITRFFKDYVYTAFASFTMRKTIRSKRAWIWESLLIVASGFTILLVALWHHVSLNFLVFGILHASAVVIYQQSKRMKITIPSTLANTLTFLFITATLPLFRFPNMSMVLDAWSSLSLQTYLALPNKIADLFNMAEQYYFLTFNIVRASPEVFLLIVNPLDYIVIASILLFVFLMPNTSQLCNYETDGLNNQITNLPYLHKKILKLLTKYQLHFAGVLCGGSIVLMLWQRPSGFIYWDF